MPMNTTEDTTLEDVSLPALLAETIESAKDLAADEAKKILAEASEELERIERIGGLLACAVPLATAGLAWVGVAVLFAMHATWVAFLLVGLGSIAIAAGLAYAAYRIVPEVTFARTRQRIEARAHRLAAAARDEGVQS